MACDLGRAPGLMRSVFDPAFGPFADMGKERASVPSLVHRRFADRAVVSLTISIALGCVAMFAACLFYSRCADALHDTRFLTGWVLALTLAVLCFPQTLRLLRVASGHQWLRLHLAVWTIGVVLFGFHIESHGPNAPFEYALTGLFGVYALSGLGLAGLFVVNRRASAGRPAETIEEFLVDWVALGERVDGLRQEARTKSCGGDTLELFEQAAYRMSLRPRSGLQRMLRPATDASPLTIKAETLQRIASNVDREALKRLSEAMSDADTLEARFVRRMALRRATFAHVFITCSLITLGMMHGTLLSAHGFMAHVVLGK